MFRQRSRTTSASGSAGTPQVARSASSATNATKEEPSDHPQPRKTRFGFSEIANLFIRLRRHQTKVAQASEARNQAAPAEVAETPASPGAPRDVVFPSSIAPTESEATHTSRLVLTPPMSPSRNRVRRLTGTPYTRTRSTSGTNAKAKPHHLVSTSGVEPITHPGVNDNKVDGVHPVPVEYSERFEVIGGVNTAILLRATRKAILEIVANVAAGANALCDESWECTICGPKNGHYKVQIVYSATATRCSRPDVFRPVALDKAKGIPGLMTIVKRNDV